MNNTQTSKYENHLDRITTNPEVLVGKPIIRGMRISVELILNLLSNGMSHKDILEEYPDLEKEDIIAVIQYADKVVKEKYLMGK